MFYYIIIIMASLACHSMWSYIKYMMMMIIIIISSSSSIHVLAKSRERLPKYALHVSILYTIILLPHYIITYGLFRAIVFVSLPWRSNSSEPMRVPSAETLS